MRILWECKTLLKSQFKVAVKKQKNSYLRLNETMIIYSRMHLTLKRMKSLNSGSSNYLAFILYCIQI